MSAENWTPFIWWPGLEINRVTWRWPHLSTSFAAGGSWPSIKVKTWNLEGTSNYGYVVFLLFPWLAPAVLTLVSWHLNIDLKTWSFFAPPKKGRSADRAQSKIVPFSRNTLEFPKQEAIYLDPRIAWRSKDREETNGHRATKPSGVVYKSSPGNILGRLPGRPGSWDKVISVGLAKRKSKA